VGYRTEQRGFAMYCATYAVTVTSSQERKKSNCYLLGACIMFFVMFLGSLMFVDENL
jgi:hypothetical protein